MAIFAPGSVIGSVSGDLGGVSFVNPSGSGVVRKKRRPSNVASAGAILQQTRIAAVAHAWAELAPDDQQSWRTLANSNPSRNRLGIARKLSGYQTYQYRSLNLLAIGEAIPTTPSFAKPAIHLDNLNFASSVADGIRATMNAPGVGVTIQSVIYGRQLFRTTAINHTNVWTFLASSKADNPTSIEFTGDWQSRIGVLPILGQFIGMKWVNLDSAGLPVTSTIQFIETTA